MISIRPALLAALAAVSACDLDTTNTTVFYPALQIANAAIRTSPAHLHLDGSFGSITAVPVAPGAVDGTCPFVLNGSRLFEFVHEDTLYASVVGSLSTNATYLVVLVDAVTGADTVYRTIVAGDDVSTSTVGHIGVRVINGSSAAGDVYITAPAEEPSAATLVMSNVGPAATTQSLDLSFVMRPETATRVRLYDVGTTTNPRSDLVLTHTDARRLTTVIFMDPQTTGDPGAMQVNACN